MDFFMINPMNLVAIVVFIVGCGIGTYLIIVALSQKSLQGKSSKIKESRIKRHLEIIRKAHSTLALIKDELGIVNPQQKMLLSMPAFIALYSTLGECAGTLESESGEPTPEEAEKAATHSRSEAIALLSKNLEAATKLLEKQASEIQTMQNNAALGKLIRSRFASSDPLAAPTEIVVSIEDLDTLPEPEEDQPGEGSAEPTGFALSATQETQDPLNTKRFNSNPEDPYDYRTR